MKKTPDVINILNEAIVKESEKLKQLETKVNNIIITGGGGSGNVDLLDRYVTKETGNASQITFNDGQTFQQKLDAGTLKGDKGDTGAQGPQGIQGKTGAQGPQGAQGLKGDKGDPGTNAENPNFTFLVNMVPAGTSPSSTVTGTYPNLVVTLNIPYSTGGDSGVTTEEFIYYGRLSASEVGIPPIKQYNEITANMVKAGANITRIEPTTLGKTSLGLATETAEGDYAIIAVPTSKGYTVTKDNGIGGKVPFNDEEAGANGEVKLVIDGVQYDLYGEFYLSQGEKFIYID